MSALIPVPVRSTENQGGLVLADPQYECERIGKYAGVVAKVCLNFDEPCHWQLCIAPRVGLSRTPLLSQSDVDESQCEMDLIEILGHEIYIPQTDILILETRGSMSRCVTYLRADS